jgi:ribosomal protein L7/L12
MELWQLVLASLIILVILTLSILLTTALLAASIRPDLARLDRKVNLLLKHMNIPYETAFELSERVKELARDPSRKIAAIKAYREETGAGLAEAKEAVEAWIRSVQR